MCLGTTTTARIIRLPRARTDRVRRITRREGRTGPVPVMRLLVAPAAARVVRLMLARAGLAVPAGPGMWPLADLVAPADQPMSRLADQVVLVVLRVVQGGARAMSLPAGQAAVPASGTELRGPVLYSIISITPAAPEELGA